MCVCVSASDDSARIVFVLTRCWRFYLISFKFSSKNSSLPIISIFKGDKNLVFTGLVLVSCFLEV